jgi:hypothetical protein
MATTQILNKRAAIGGIVAFIGITIVLLMLAPIILKVVTIPLGKFPTSIAPISNQSAEATTYGLNKINSLFDIVIVAVFFFNILLLLVSSFLIDIHPAFLIVYIVAGFFLFMFVPAFEAIIGSFLDNPSFSDVMTFLPMTKFIYDNFAMLMLGVFFITGLVMFAKFKGMGGGQNAGGY